VVSLAIIALVSWLVVLLLPSRPWSTRERLAAVAPVPNSLPDLSRIVVLIPARNEAAAITGTLSALAAQGTGLRVVVIDDQSDDGTAEAVRAAAANSASAGAVQVVQGQPLPEGWGGKLWALEQGLAMVDREYCLLLDAEITLAPGMLAALLAQADDGNRALVSIMARLRCETFWERLLVPPFIFFFKLLYPFAAVNTPGRRPAAAAGGCVLVRTEALRATGGFSAMRDALIDDCTLAARIKRDGHSIWLGLSHDVASVRSYPTLAGFRRMVTRTAFTQLRYSYLLLLLVCLIMLIMFVVPWLAVLFAPGLTAIAAGIAAVLVMAVVYVPTVRFYGLPALWALTLPLAGVLFLAMTIESAINYSRGVRAEWKGRRYAAH